MILSFIFFFLFYLSLCTLISFFFFFNDTATTEIYTLSLHDALPICLRQVTDIATNDGEVSLARSERFGGCERRADRKSTRLNSSHLVISYAVFCLKKKKNSTNLRLNPTISYGTLPEISNCHPCLPIH